MNAFVKSCEAFLHYPTNFLGSDVRTHTLQAYHTRLKHQADRLFVDEKDAAVSFLDLPNSATGRSIESVIAVTEIRPLKSPRYLCKNLEQP